MKLMGYPANVAVSYDIGFHRYLRVEYLTLDEKPFVEALITYFQYQPAKQQGATAANKSVASGGEEQSESEMVNANSWQPNFANLDPTTLSVGDQLPALVIPIARKLIVGGAIATRDFIPVHHNVPEAQAAGMPDIFMNILTTSGLAARYLSDWAGQDSQLRQMKFNLMAPNFPGDAMVMEGEVSCARRKPKLDELAATIESFGGSFTGYELDVGDTDVFARMSTSRPSNTAASTCWSTTRPRSDPGRLAIQFWQRRRQRVYRRAGGHAHHNSPGGQWLDS